MKNLVISPILLVFILISSCSKDTINGSGDLVSESRNISNFTKVKIDGVFEVMITQGDVPSVEIIANENIINMVKTVVGGNELKLYLDDDYNYQNIELYANIIVPSIKSIKNSGSGNILILNVDNDDDFNVNNSGSGDISIEGTTQNLILKNEGSGEFNGFLFTTNDCSIRVIGSGDCKVNCANNLNTNIKGSGSIYYVGLPTIKADISGSGEIINAN